MASVCESIRWIVDHQRNDSGSKNTLGYGSTPHLTWLIAMDIETLVVWNAASLVLGKVCAVESQIE